MGWIEFFANVVDNVLSWPVAVFAIALLLRKQLAELVRTVENMAVEAGGARFSITRKLDKAREAIEEESAAPKPSSPQPELEPSASSRDQPAPPTDTFQNLWLWWSTARLHPTDTILEAWIEVEDEARQLAHALNINTARKNASVARILDALSREGILPRKLKSAADELRAIRNRVVHQPNVRISPSEAFEFVRLANELASYLRSQRDERQNPIDSSDP